MRIPNYERLEQEDFSDTATIAASIKSTRSVSKPKTYYGDGPFDAPSSDSEEEEALLENDAPNTPRLERGFSEPITPVPRRNSSLRFLVTTLAILVTLSGIIGIIAAHTYVGTVYRLPGTRKITMDHIFNGTFSVQRQSISWVPEAGDGVFSISEDGYIKLVDLKSNTTTSLVNTKDVRDEHGKPLAWSNWQLSPDMKFILIKADYKKQWRWSSFGNYYIHNIADKTTHPIIPPSDPPSTAYATWSPTGQSIAYVTDNDLYVLTSPSPSTSPIRVTHSGNASLFHGVPDWVYEEEVFGTDYALWWSPDSQKVAFLRFDETDVDEYSFPVYNPTEDNDAVIPYTSEVTMKYPKPGYNNPLVSVHVFDLGKFLTDEDVINAGFPAENVTMTLDWDGRHPVENSIILEVAWVDDEQLLIKEVNRNADNGNVIFFDFKGTADSRSNGRVVRKLGKEGEHGDLGWIDNEQNIFPLPSSLTPSGSTAYLDVTPSSDGYNHIALFSPADSSTPRFLTSGDWEVSSGIKGVNVETGHVYFEAAYPTSVERRLYSVPIPTITTMSSLSPVEPTLLTETEEDEPGYFSTDFSPKAGFYLSSYQGPNTPWQRLVMVNNSDFDYVLTTNDELSNATSEYEAATVIHSTIEVDGYELNVKEIRPPRMDDSGRMKYAVLFRVYGGPFSQTVDTRFIRDFHDYLACGMQYIVVTVDGRGTGYKGRKLRNVVKGNLGYWETKDQIEAARIWASKPYVDPKRIGIWGWSYGGFMSSKVVEADAGIHSLAVAVAPVTSWRLYDSIYTERYLNLPSLNPGGYVNASISNVTGFHHVDYLLMHGSADDNVHFANSAHLLDMFTKERVRNFKFRMFTDSDHAIYKRGANREVYEYMKAFLEEKWGSGGRKRGW
ncbi:dipeptidyl aminopeptidase [Dendrothele bispora CBS 962.96]|uniref:Dipeptidyl aminopeptidase n=1 Tax=Dendrothele bispora (strain CBS 962.96) TaxID=1314807 RepID=A0A4S8M5Z8_DENBC|nr:dipeptidyl aminopeptidase [Dendrothele bispora CBS 962.96]